MGRTYRILEKTGLNGEWAVVETGVQEREGILEVLRGWAQENVGCSYKAQAEQEEQDRMLRMEVMLSEA